MSDRRQSQAALKAEANKLAAQKKMEKFSGGAMIPQDMQAKALQSAKGRIPGKYQLPQTTDLTVKVDGGHTRFDFELKD